MYSVVINGAKVIEVPPQLQVHLADILAGTTKDKHEKICALLRIGRFTPKQAYILRAVTLQIFDDHRCAYSLGGWRECYNCHCVVETGGWNLKSDACPKCGKKKMPNFKNDPPTNKVKVVRRAK